MNDVFNPYPGSRSVAAPDELLKMQDEEWFLAYLKNNRIENIRYVDGAWCGLQQLAFTWSVCCDVTINSTFAYRWCFEDKEEALFFLNTMASFDDVPAKRESLKGHRYRDSPRMVQFDNLGFAKW